MRTIVLLLLIFLYSSVLGQVRLPRLISDGAILQRETPLTLWGWAAPGEKVTLSFNQKQYSATADKEGRWAIQLPPQKAGGPHQLAFTASNIVTVRDVLFGDVWLCSGQSNMELTLERVRYKYPQEVAAANNASIRQFEVPDRYNFQQKEEDLPAGQWLTATPNHILRFSAVGYFFADELYRTYKVPIGLINAALGGSPAEAWISEEALKAFPAHYNEAQKFKDPNHITQLEAKDRSAQGAWSSRLSQADEGAKGGWASPTLDDGQWSQTSIPGYWQAGELKGVNGVVWFRKDVTLTKEQAEQGDVIQLGRIVDADSVYINGRFVGTTSYQYPPRRYTVPAGVLKEGKNVLAVRVISNGGTGGFVPDKPYELQVGKDVIDLKGPWKYRIGARMEPMPGQTFVRWKPTGLFNAMIAPVTNYAIKGVTWYQGESNAGNPAEYAALMKTLITDWRTHWGGKSLPFLLVQLPNFMEPRSQPGESNWAALRQAQLQTLAVPNTALAVTIDLGEWNDIHPLTKLDVGKRLALQAKRLVYGDKKVVASGPMYQSVERSGSKMILSFTHTGSGLVARGGGELKEFAIAGADRKFVWAKAQILGNKVVVWSDAVPQPVAVRYAWADNPSGANLYNKEGLPAAPFEATLDTTKPTPKTASKK